MPITQLSHVTFKDVHSLNGPGGAIKTTGNVRLRDCLFDFCTSKNEGGAIYVDGSGLFESKRCCFIRCHTTFISNDKGGNSFSIKNHSTTIQDTLILKCAETDSSNNGDSSFMIFYNEFYGKFINNTGNHGYSGSISGSFQYGKAEFSLSQIENGTDLVLIEAFHGADLQIQKSLFVRNTFSENTVNAVKSNVSCSDCTFYKNPNLSDRSDGSRIDFKNCVSDSISRPGMNPLEGIPTKAPKQFKIEQCNLSEPKKPETKRFNHVCLYWLLP